MTLLENDSISKKEHSRYRVINKDKKVSISICIISDSDIIAKGITSLFNEDSNKEKITITTKNSFLMEHTNNEFDIVITEIEFLDGIDASFVKSVKSFSHDAKIIVYTSQKNAARRVAAMDNGADFFIYFDDRFELLEFIVKKMIAKPLK